MRSRSASISSIRFGNSLSASLSLFKSFCFLGASGFEGIVEPVLLSDFSLPLVFDHLIKRLSPPASILCHPTLFIEGDGGRNHII
jgi:hypothetical protein